jgi:HSP20 family protein
MSNIITLMDQLLDDSFRPLSVRGITKSSLNPALNVSEFKDHYKVSAAIPGIDSDKVKVELRENILNISYEHQDNKQDKDEEVLREEYSYYSFSRSVSLPKDIDQSSIKASSKKGMLYITINKIPESAPKVIQIEKHD